MSFHKKSHDDMRTIIICRGLPASSKSTWALEQLKKEPERFVRVNKDNIRRGLIGETWNAEIENLVHSISEKMLSQSLDAGYDVIVDNTHLTQKSVNLIHKIASNRGNVLVMEKVFPVSYEECCRRNALREGVNRVPDNVMLSMGTSSGIIKHGYRDFADKQTYYEPKKFADPPQIDLSLPKAIICDLDGTLALIEGRNPYDASECDVVDRPNIPVVETVKAFYDKGYKIIFMSGRDEKYREPTIRFIEKYVKVKDKSHHNAHLDIKPEINIAYELHMRPQDDMRKDSIIKRELYDAHVAGKYRVLFVMDDRNQVVDLWRRELGLTTFQVAEGDF